jgi:hypothetical protein
MSALEGTVVIKNSGNARGGALLKVMALYGEHIASQIDVGRV